MEIISDLLSFVHYVGFSFPFYDISGVDLKKKDLYDII